MDKLIILYLQITTQLDKLSSLPLLLLRFTLAYGFFEPATIKLQNINSVAEWFSSIGIPAPMLNAYLAAGVEAAGVAMLSLGIGTRIISVPLLITMFVAIKTVHWENGFAAGDNGFEIPLYYSLMLLLLLILGAGQWSLDYLIEKKYKNKEKTIE